METNEILMLVGLVIVGYMILKFLWNMVGNVIKLIILIVIVVLGIHFVRPDLLGEHDSKVTNFIESVEDEVEKGANKLGDMVEEKVDSTKKEVVDSVTSEL